MREAVRAACQQADMLIMNAAVADFRPASVSDEKIKKRDDEGMMLHLVQNPDVVGELAGRRDLFKVGFAAETNDLLRNARSKLQRKGLNVIVANDAVASIGQPEIAFIVLDDERVVELPRLPKAEAAAVLLDLIVERFEQWLNVQPLSVREIEEQ
jgi:phosphopantothenoylcysteine decarboxylase/phosphopantothenate--cysteine ligase